MHNMATNPDITYAWAEITKVLDQEDGSVLVEGRLGGETLDMDQQKLAKSWLDKAVPKWMETGPNVRAMHSNIAAGRGVSATDTGSPEGGWRLVSKIVDPVEVLKCKAG